MNTMQGATPIKYNVARPTPRAAVDLAGCNHCGAQIGERCYTPSGRPTKAHTPRIERAWSLEINRAYLERACR